MAYLAETASYSAGVYQIETTDPVLGGPSGTSNKPLKDLANRTAYLKAHVDALEALDPAPKASPALTGTPTAPKAAAGTNTAQIASTSFVQDALGGYLLKAVTGGAVVLTDAEANNPILIFNGALTADLDITVPTTIKRTWCVYNQTTGGYSLTVRSSAGGSTVNVAQGRRMLIFTTAGSVYAAVTDFTDAALRGNPTAPTAAKFDKDTTIATTGFVQNALGNWQKTMFVSTSATLAADDTGAVVRGSGVVTITLPATSSAADGCNFVISAAASATVTVALADAADFIGVPGANLATLTLNAGDSLYIVRRPGYWSAWGGSALLPYTSVFKSANWTTQAKGDVSTRPATTEFVQRALGSMQKTIGYTSSTVTLTAADVGAMVRMAGSGSITLPATADVPDGAGFVIVSAINSTVTLSLAAGDTFAIGQSSVTSLTLNAGDNVQLVRRVTNWVVVAGSVLLPYTQGFAASLLENGWKKTPSGDIEQWGSTGGLAAGGSLVVTFPIAFPSECFNVQATIIANTTDTGGGPLRVHPASTTQFTINNPGTTPVNFHWRANGK